MLTLARAALLRLLPPGRPAFTDSAAPGSTCFLSELLVDILDGLPIQGHSLSRREASQPSGAGLWLRFAATRFQRHGTDHDSKPLPSFPGFCLRARPLQCGQKEHRSSRATAKGFDRRSARAAICRRPVTGPRWPRAPGWHTSGHCEAPLECPRAVTGCLRPVLASLPARCRESKHRRCCPKATTDS